MSAKSAKTASHAALRQKQYMAMAKEMPSSYSPSLKTGYRKVSYPDSDKTGESIVSGSPHPSPGSVSHSLPSISPPLSPTTVPQAKPKLNSENSELKTGVPVVSEDNDKQAKADSDVDADASADAAEAKEWQDFVLWQRRVSLLRAAFEKATDEEEATKLRAQWALEVVTKQTSVYDEWMSEFDVFTSCQDIIKEVKNLLPGELASWKVTTRTYYTVKSWLKTKNGSNVDLRSSFFKKPGTRVGILEIAPGSPAHQEPAFFLSGPFTRACRASPTSKKAVLMWTCDDQILGRVLYGDKRPDGMLTCASHVNGKHQRRSVVIEETAHSQSAERAALKMRLLVIKDHKLMPNVESTLHTGIIWEILEERRTALEDLRVIKGVDYGDIFNQLKGDLFSALTVQDPNHPNSVDLNHRQVWFGATRVRVHFYDLRGDPQLANPPEIYNIVDNDPNSETNLAFVQKMQAVWREAIDFIAERFADEEDAPDGEADHEPAVSAEVLQEAERVAERAAEMLTDLQNALEFVERNEAEARRKMSKPPSAMELFFHTMLVESKAKHLTLRNRGIADLEAAQRRLSILRPAHDNAGLPLAAILPQPTLELNMKAWGAGFMRSRKETAALRARLWPGNPTRPDDDDDLDELLNLENEDNDSWDSDITASDSEEEARDPEWRPASRGTAGVPTGPPRRGRSASRRGEGSLR